MDFFAPLRRHSRICALGFVLSATMAPLTLAGAAPAQAAPNVAKAWGFNKDGELGNGTETEGSDVPVAVAKLSGVHALAGGARDSFALMENGSVMAWGEGRLGQLGDGSTEDSNVPVEVSGLKEVVAIAAGANHALALLKNGTVMAWGRNAEGELGNGTTMNSDVPVEVSGLKEVVAVAAGEVHSLALLKDGTVMAWGWNGEDQLGDGTEGGESDVPVAVSNLSGVSAIAAGGRHSLARLSDGSVMAWGYNVGGQLGDGSTTSRDLPVAVGGLSEVVAIAAGLNHSLAVQKGGAVMAWGTNSEGELGDGSSTGPETCGSLPPFGCSRKPVAVSALKGPTAIAAGGDHSLALLANRTVVAWGKNMSGQLGNGSKGPEACGPSSCSTTPVAVCAEGPEVPCPNGPTLSDVVSIAGGEAHSLAVVEGPPPPGLPELGRCVKAAAKKGQWTGTRCNKPAGGKGAYNWIPGAEKKKFEGSGGATTLATAHTTISCAATIIEGEYTGAKTAAATVILKGCENIATHIKCQSVPVKEGEIETTRPLEGELGFITGGAKPVVGLDLKKSSTAPNVATFYCGGQSQPEFQATVEGSVIGRMTPINHMTGEFKLVYKGAKGKQVPERFEGGATDTLAISFLKGAEPPVSEGASLASTVLIENEEPLELKAI